MRMTLMAAYNLGWSMIPVREDKRPYIDWKEYQSVRPSKEQLTLWNEQLKPAAWAVVTGKISGVIVLDFDGEEGRKTMESLGLEPHLRTGGGGYHVYVEYPKIEKDKDY